MMESMESSGCRLVSARVDVCMSSGRRKRGGGRLPAHLWAVCQGNMRIFNTVASQVTRSNVMGTAVAAGGFPSPGLQLRGVPLPRSSSPRISEVPLPGRVCSVLLWEPLGAQLAPAPSSLPSILQTSVFNPFLLKMSYPEP